MTSFKFRRHMSVGDLSAERDPFLESAFVDTGDISALLDLDNPKCIVVGRTGAGKSALLRIVEDSEQHRIIRIDPKALSLQYLEGSTIIPVLTEMGVRLNFFWTLFWRHIIALELLQRHYKIDSAQEEANFVLKIVAQFGRKGVKNERKEAALSYLREWAGEFWKDTDSKTKKLFDSLERRVQAETGAKVGPLQGTFGAGRVNQQKVEQEIVERAQEAVNKVQFQHLNEIMGILRDDVLRDEQRPYYLLIDDLDRDWVEAAYVYDLIDALVEEAGAFQRLGAVKVIVALRENIHHLVNVREGVPRGKQREKHEGLLLKLRWLRSDLTLMMDKRLHALMRGQYGERASLKAILPLEEHKGRRTGAAIDYLLNRTIQRPRDIIKFFNYCIDEAEGRGRIEWNHIFAAEKKYSMSQLASIHDEWSENYPDIGDVLRAFTGINPTFDVREIEERILAIVEEGENDQRRGSLRRALLVLAEASKDFLTPFRMLLGPKLYEVGFLGVKVSPQEPLKYFYDDPLLCAGGIPEEAKLAIHPAFHAGLAISAK